MSKINKDPKFIFNKITKLLSIAVKDRRHPFHTPVFSNISISLKTESRVVVLRKFDKENLLLNFHTDFRSPKISSLRNNNNSFFLFYDSKLKIQLRINTLSSINNDNSVTKKAWENTKLSSRKCYLSLKSPSTITDQPEDGLPEHLSGVNPSKQESEIGYSNFAVIENKINTIDWLYLDSAGHKRLFINCLNKSNPKYDWLIP